jgi:hypothetical protein
MDSEKLRRWLDDYAAAWQARSPESASRLFTANALYYETPFAEPFRGRDGIERYWRTVTADQRNVDVSTDPVGFVDGIGVAKWSATFTLESAGTRVELSGVFLLEFDDKALCRTLREWWHAR